MLDLHVLMHTVHHLLVSRFEWQCDGLRGGQHMVPGHSGTMCWSPLIHIYDIISVLYCILYFMYIVFIFFLHLHQKCVDHQSCCTFCVMTKHNSILFAHIMLTHCIMSQVNQKMFFHFFAFNNVIVHFNYPLSLLLSMFPFNTCSLSRVYTSSCQMKARKSN